MSLVDHAQKELALAGLFNKDSDYNGMLGDAVLELIQVFSKQGHSGMSAELTRELFVNLSASKPLSPLTNDPEEWMDVAPSMWQNCRRPDAFSTDGGTTYYLLDEIPRVMHTSAEKTSAQNDSK